MAVQAVVFDAYGTLLDVHAAMQRHAGVLPPDWERISVEWRQKQLEYSWVRTLTKEGTGGEYRDFWAVTRDALEYVAALHRIPDPAVLDLLMQAYRRLPAYADAVPVLTTLRQRGVRTAVLSNGGAGMLKDGLEAAGVSKLVEAVLSVDDVGVFKPHPRVYGLAASAMGLELGEMGFVSSNAWDAQAAAAAGMRVFWCNRSRQPAEYGLAASATVMAGLAELPTLLS